MYGTGNISPLVPAAPLGRFFRKRLRPALGRAGRPDFFKSLDDFCSSAFTGGLVELWPRAKAALLADGHGPAARIWPWPSWCTTCAGRWCRGSAPTCIPRAHRGPAASTGAARRLHRRLAGVALVDVDGLHVCAEVRVRTPSARRPWRCSPPTTAACRRACSTRRATPPSTLRPRSSASSTWPKWPTWPGPSPAPSTSSTGPLIRWPSSWPTAACSGR